MSIRLFQNGRQKAEAGNGIRHMELERSHQEVQLASIQLALPGPAQP